MQNDDYILFEHNLTVKDSKNLLCGAICLFCILGVSAFVLIFNVGSVFSTQAVLIKNLYFFNVVIGVVFVALCMLLRASTFAKIILTEDKIIYKPPVSVRVYEMEYSCVKSFYYNNSTLFVIGEQQQRFAVNLTKDTAYKIIGFLENKIYSDK